MRPGFAMYICALKIKNKQINGKIERFSILDSIFDVENSISFY